MTFNKLPGSEALSSQFQNQLASISKELLLKMPSSLSNDEASSVLKNIYLPAAQLIKNWHTLHNKVAFIGITGAQGSGKSLMASCLKSILENIFGLPVVSLSLDDFYLTKSERDKLAYEIHPLFATRGVPGTHDINFLSNILHGLKEWNQAMLKIPAFDKLNDDRLPESLWKTIAKKPEVILLDGWCLGADAQDQESLKIPVNILEESQDRDFVWRSYVNSCLQNEYKALFDQMDLLIALIVPDFSSIYKWRLKQEKELEKITDCDTKGMNAKQLENFIMHFERITRHMNDTIRLKADICYYLNKDHGFDRLTNKSPDS